MQIKTEDSFLATPTKTAQLLLFLCQEMPLDCCAMWNINVTNKLKYAMYVLYYIKEQLMRLPQHLQQEAKLLKLRSRHCGWKRGKSLLEIVN